MQVYKIENLVNGKVYIGITKVSLDRRLAQHVGVANRGAEYPISCAIRKYGKKSFKIESLYIAFDERSALDAERELICTYKSIAGMSGYNVRKGGEIGLLPGWGLKGEKSPTAKITEEIVIFLRNPLISNITDEEMVFLVNDRFGCDVKYGGVRSARVGKSWKHLDHKYPPIKPGVRRFTEKSLAACRTASQSVEARAKIAKAASKRLSGNPQPWKCKLTIDQVREIVSSPLSQHKIAKLYNVSQGTISLIRNGKILTYNEAL